jgi:hypothetical protein
MPGTKSRRSAYGGLLLAAVLLASLLFGSPATAQPGGPGAAQRREDARVHFERGIGLRDKERWAEALAEFQASRSLFLTLNGTTNAAACLVNLERYLEALEMYESALRDFSEKLKDEDKRDVLLVIKLLYNSVGTIEIVGSEPGATVQLDHVSRGELPLGAPLRVSRGAHTVRVVKEGYEPFEQRLDVAGGTTVQATARLSRIQEIDTLEIARLPDQPLDAWLRSRKERGPRRPPHFLAEVSAAAPLLMSLGGDTSAGCMATCSTPLGYGPGLVARGGYDIAGLSFGVSAGYLNMAQAVRGRSAKVEVGGEAPLSVSVDDVITLRGALLGVWVGYSWGEALLLHLRLGAGGLVGAVTDSRMSAQVLKSGGRSFGPFDQSAAARFVYVAPEVRAGIRLASRVELTLGIEVPVLIAAPGPVWRQEVFADTLSGSDRASYAWFAAAPLTGPVFALFMPVLGVRYDFY